MTCEVIDGRPVLAQPRIQAGATPAPTRQRGGRTVPEDTTQVQRYIAAWNETEPQARRRAVAALFTEDARYVDPLVDVRGHDGIEAAIVAVHEQFPGWVFRLAGPVDAHHDQVRFTWSLGPEGEEPPVIGSDVAVTDGDGRFARVSGFLDRVPQQ
jgi:hypothetical protein